MHDEDLREAFDEWLRPVREASPPDIRVIRRRLRRRRARNAATGVTALAAAAGLAVTVHLATGSSRGPAGTEPATAASQVAAVTTSPSPVQGGYQVSASYTVSSPVRTIVVSGQLGSISVTGSQRANVSVSEQLRYSVKAPAMTRDLTGGTLKLGYSCQVEQMCGASYSIQVPRGITVLVSNKNGTIRLSSLAGPVTATSDLGAITATGLSSGSADFTSQLGDVDASFTSPPANVRATTTLGAVTILVPGTESYHVNIQTAGLGTASVTVPEADTSAHSISVDTRIGAITVGPSGSSGSSGS